MTRYYEESAGKLDKRAWGIWVSIVLVSVITTVGLGSLLILDNAKIQSLWPWAQTDRALLAGLALLVLIFALYLTSQQRKLIAGRMTHINHLEAILNVSRVMAAETKAQPVFDSIVEGCLSVFRCDNASLMLLDRKTDELVVRAASGHRKPGIVLGARLAMGRGVAGKVAEAGEPMILGGKVDPKGFKGLDANKTHIPTTSMIVPITLRGDILGVLSVASQQKTTFTQADLHALTVFAEHAGVCCRHTERAEWMRQTIQRLDGDLEKYRSTRRRAA